MKIHIFHRSQIIFKDRFEAGKILAEKLIKLHLTANIVLGIPRGGIIIAKKLAQALGCGIDLVLARKLKAPFNPELAIGAVAENGKLFLNEEIAYQSGADKDYIEREKERQMAEIRRRVEIYRKVKPKVPLRDKTVVLTDDGVATGATMEAAIWASRQEHPKKIIVALPVGAGESVERIAKSANEVVCVAVPPFFSAIAQFYTAFPQVEDEEAIKILKFSSVEHKEAHLTWQERR
ncbi:MAG: phosphoribosyltransferase family protein [Candidatus Omnitrophica bacterium]|nr:phosphoribosyltransferase family protein [Candidatus Omnitrophota bacterium]MDD5553494.1 phosphoribosyltransferase family protein [Candidatus Omnitrophota bacterium]